MGSGHFSVEIPGQFSAEINSIDLQPEPNRAIKPLETNARRVKILEQRQ